MCSNPPKKKNQQKLGYSAQWTHSVWRWWKRPWKSSPPLWPWPCRRSQHWSWAGGCGWEFHGVGKPCSSCLGARWCRCPCAGPDLWPLGQSAGRAAGNPHPPSSPLSATCCWSRTHGLDLSNKDGDIQEKAGGPCGESTLGEQVKVDNGRENTGETHLSHRRELRRWGDGAAARHCRNTCRFRWTLQWDAPPGWCGCCRGSWTCSVCVWRVWFASLQARCPRTSAPERLRVWPQVQNSAPP